MRYRVKGTKLYLRNQAPEYEAASLGRRMKLWQPSAAGPNTITANQATTLRNRSRDAIRNQGFAASARTSLVANIVGSQIKPLFSTPDKGFNAAAAELWERWEEQADADGVRGWYGQIANAVGAMVESGEAFLRFRLRRPEDGLEVPLQVQTLEADFVPLDKTEIAASANRIISGIEVDFRGQRVAYWMHQEHPGDLQGRQFQSPMPVRVPASEVCHLFDSIFSRPGTLRGDPWLGRALLRLNNLHRYDDAELDRKRTAALYAGFIRRPLPQGVTLDEAAEIWGEADESGNVAVVTLEPGTMQVLGVGEDIEFAQPQDHGAGYEPFVRHQARGIAASIGVLYEQLTGDYSTINDRTYRAAVNEFRRLCGIYLHNVVVQQMCRPVLRRWMDTAIISGALTPPRGMTAADLYRVRWMGQGWSYLNPVQEVQAQREAVRAGFRSRSDVVAEMGWDAEVIDEEVKRDNDRADEMGLVYDSDARQVDKSGAEQASITAEAMPDQPADQPMPVA